MRGSPSGNIKRQAFLSKAKLSYMPPASQSKQKQNVLTERNNDKKKLAMYENTEVTLTDNQHKQMFTIINKYEEVGKDDLYRFLQKG